MTHLSLRDNAPVSAHPPEFELRRVLQELNRSAVRRANYRWYLSRVPHNLPDDPAAAAEMVSEWRRLLAAADEDVRKLEAEARQGGATPASIAAALKAPRLPSQ
jgi:hypothetical protein